jgi:hypothetical protein
MCWNIVKAHLLDRYEKMTSKMTASMLYDLNRCLHRVTKDTFAEAYYSWHNIARFNGFEQTNSPVFGSL